MFDSIPAEHVVNDPSLYTDPPQPSIDSPVRYRGWNIWRWTFWKGRWAVRVGPSRRPHWHDLCALCAKWFEEGDLAVCEMEYDKVYHAWCHPYRGQLYAQWCAEKHGNFAISSSCGYVGRYKRGASFPLRDTELTYYTDTDILVKARSDSFYALLDFLLKIDTKPEAVEDHAYL